MIEKKIAAELDVSNGSADSKSADFFFKSIANLPFEHIITGVAAQGHVGCFIRILGCCALEIPSRRSIR